MTFRMIFLKYLILIGFLLIGKPISAEQPVPELQGYYTNAGVTLSHENAILVGNLDKKLADFEKETGGQIFILIVATAKPEPIAQFAQKVFDKWQPGRKKIDDGLLVVLAIDDRESYIATGRGLEGAIPDILAKRILRNVGRPYFAKEKYIEGLIAISDILIQAARNEALPKIVTTNWSDDSIQSAILYGFLGFSASIFGTFLFWPKLWRIILFSVNISFWCFFLYWHPEYYEAEPWVRGWVQFVCFLLGFISIGGGIAALLKKHKGIDLSGSGTTEYSPSSTSSNSVNSGNVQGRGGQSSGGGASDKW